MVKPKPILLRDDGAVQVWELPATASARHDLEDAQGQSLRVLYGGNHHHRIFFGQKKETTPLAHSIPAYEGLSIVRAFSRLHIQMAAVNLTGSHPGALSTKGPPLIIEVHKHRQVVVTPTDDAGALRHSRDASAFTHHSVQQSGVISGAASPSETTLLDYGELGGPEPITGEAIWSPYEGYAPSVWQQTPYAYLDGAIRLDVSAGSLTAGNWSLAAWTKCRYEASGGVWVTGAEIAFASRAFTAAADDANDLSCYLGAGWNYANAAGTSRDRSGRLMVPVTDLKLILTGSEVAPNDATINAVIGFRSR